MPLLKIRLEGAPSIVEREGERLAALYTIVDRSRSYARTPTVVHQYLTVQVDGSDPQTTIIREADENRRLVAARRQETRNR